MIRETWIGSDDLAKAAGITRRAAKKALSRAIVGKRWNGTELVVRELHGRGGRSGIRYEVALSSLSEALQRAFNNALEPLPLFSPPALRIVPASNQGAERHRRFMILREALDHVPRSVERATALRRAASVHGVPLRTLHRWIKRLDDTGGDLAALGRKRPADAGKARVTVTRAFDKAFVAAGYDAVLLPELRERLVDFITGAWAGPPGRAGRNRVILEAETAFRRLCRERGYELPRRALSVPGRLAEPFREYHLVDMRANDRKRFDDMKPRGRRDNSKWMPLQQVVMDVKPLDCVVRRADGSEGWPRLIGFMDAGTHRIFAHIVLLDRGEGVRQEHVTAAFVGMVAHPEWGFPQTLYRDNGSEYFHFDKISDALALINDKGVRTIVNAKPYSGASKPIESLFSDLDNFVFSQMAGWTGGNRMNKKTQTLGKPPAPYPGSFEQFEEEAQARIRDFMGQPVGSGPFKGRSPLQVYAERVLNGWSPARIDPSALDAAFCRRETRRVDRGAVSIAGIRYLHPELPNGRTIDIALPDRRAARPLALLPDFGWVALEPDLLHLPWDRSGAQDAGRMQRTNERRVTALKRTAGTIDLAANLNDRLAELPSLPAPGRAHTVSTGEDQPNFASAYIEAGERQADEMTEKERRKAALDHETRRLERLNARDKIRAA